MARLLKFGVPECQARDYREVELRRADYPILENDPDRQALVNPRPRRGRSSAPECVVLCFFLEVIDELCGAAVRDEGTSYHYLAPSRELNLEASVVEVLSGVLADHEVPYQVGKTWTTDAPYRETPARIRRRREEGCLTVEMETAALTAVARFRGVSFGQFLYAGDDVSGAAWDHRYWNTHSSRTDLFWLAVETVTRLSPATDPPV